MQRISLVWLLLGCVLATPALAIDTTKPLPTPELQARYENLTHKLRCLVCQNESIANSNAELAGDLRGQVRKLLIEGKSDRQIINYMTDRYGQFVLYKPPVEPSTWLLWVGPFVVLLLGGVAIAFIIRRRARMVAPDAEPEPVDEDPWS